MNETNCTALDYAIRAGAQGADVLPLARQFAAFLAGDASWGNEEAPKATRGRKSKDASAQDDGAASASSSPNTSNLEPADAGNVDGPTGTPGAGTTEATTAGTSTSTASAASEPAGPTRDDALTAATKFSQTHGVEKLEAALEAVGAKKFSEIPADKYAAFIAEMDKAGKSASALS